MTQQPSFNLMISLDNQHSAPSQKQTRSLHQPHDLEIRDKKFHLLAGLTPEISIFARILVIKGLKAYLFQRCRTNQILNILK